MTARKNPPLLRRSDLTGRVYVITRYTRRPGNVLVSSEKWDVTEDFDAINAERGLAFDPAHLATLHEAATPGDWVRHDGEVVDHWGFLIAASTNEDAALIVYLRNAVPTILDQAVQAYRDAGADV